MTLLESFDPTTDFFTSNPQLKPFLPPLPSPILWALFLIYHPQSRFSDESLTNRINLVRLDYLKDSSFDPTAYPEVIEFIQSHATPMTHRLLQSWKDKLHERDELANSLSYSLENFELIDKLLITYPKLWEGYELVNKKLMEENQGKTKGDIRQSLIEEGKI